MAFQIPAAKKSLSDVPKQVWLPPPDLTVSEWADRERKLSPEASAEPGQWRTDRAEYQRGMMDAVNDPDVDTVVLMTSAQIGKTELVNNVVGYYIAHDPAPILTVQPTIQMGEAWSKDRLTPMLRDTPSLRRKVGAHKSRSGNNTILHKVFPGGHVTIAGANSPASLASRPVRIVLCDEVDRYPPSAGEEGDPVSLARKRTRTFWNRKIILVSTPTIKGTSRIEKEYELSDQRRYFVPCPHCGEFQHLEWARISFDKENPSDVVYACTHGCVIEEKDKLKMIAQGEWRATNAFNGRAGFHLNELYSPWSSWRDVVKGFLEAKGTPETLKTWVNTSLGETWEEKGEQVDHAGLMERREAYDVDSLPDEIEVITAAVDIQGDRLEALSQGWGEEKERWNIEHKIFWGDPEKSDVWEELDHWLLKNYSVGSRSLKVQCAVVDSSFKPDCAYNFTKPRQGRRVFSQKGSSEYYAPLASKPRQIGRQRAMLYICGADTAKDSILLSSLEIDEPGPGYIHFPHNCDEEFFKQLTAETRRTEFSRGQKRFRWVNKRDRNEILDLHTGNLCAYTILNPDISKIKKKRADKPEPPQEQLRRTTQKRKSSRKKSNWVTNF